jgi:hypothetical protein
MVAQEPEIVTPAEAAVAVPSALQPDLSEPSDALLELYKMAVEMADRVSARRGIANAFFLSVQTAMLSVISIAATAGGRVPWWTALILAMAGISISATWWLQLCSYRTLNGAKFDIINSVEPRLPVRIFSDEWKILTRDSSEKWWNRYSELGRTERMVPWIFAALHAALFIGILST